jgi:hypothetical protein
MSYVLIHERHELKEKVENLLKQKIKEKFNISDDECSINYKKLIKNNILQITPPEIEITINSSSNPGIIEFITFDKRGGKSKKPGNIKFNYKKLFKDSPQLILSGIGLFQFYQIITPILSVITIYLSYGDIKTIDLTKEEAYVIISLWQNCDEKNTISFEAGYKATNDFLKKRGEPTISREKFDRALESLLQIQSIESKDNKILLIEEISKDYTDII